MANRPTAYRGVFPNSSKVYVEGPGGIRVPMREITLSGGESPLRVYDTSGPEGYEVRSGLPALRGRWIGERDVGKNDEPTGLPASRPTDLIPEGLRRPVYRGRGPVTQLDHARRGGITPEMEFVALR